MSLRSLIQRHLSRKDVLSAGGSRGRRGLVRSAREPRMRPRIFVYGMSRAGTTLLTTILDSHPDLSMGYELMPKNVADAGAAAEAIRAAGSNDPAACAEAIRVDRKDEPLAKLVLRADRCLVTPSELADILSDVAGRDDQSPLAVRTAISEGIGSLKVEKEGTKATGWKLNTPQIAAFDKLMGRRAAYVFILRDPRDVWRSHVEHDFPRTVEEVATTWNRYLETFEKFAARHPRRTHLVRYEDLVSTPKESLDAMCAALRLPRDPAMDRFYASKASVLRGGHGNSEQISQDFFTTSVGTWRGNVPQAEVEAIESLCFEGMERHGYERRTLVGFQFTKKQASRRQAWLDQRRNYFGDEYANLVVPAIESLPHRTWLEATNPSPGAEQLDEVLVIRHDIDQDIENAVLLARWEHEHGIRSTYCVLHSAWYYGRRDKGGHVLAHSERMVECCLEIQALGHEMSLHNNAVVVALQSRKDPYDVLADELAYLRARGLDIRGTSGHGTPLRRQLDFTNDEIFSECVRGGPRTISYEGHDVTIGVRSMREFGLDYEGYDLPRDVYVSDSGGRLKTVTDIPGRAGKTLAELDTPYKRVVGILTHPVWWDLERTAPPGRPDVSWRAITESVTDQH